MWILSASLLVGGVLAAPVEDEILSLPGWLGNGGKLPSRHYSGLIDITGEQGVAPAESMQVHYYYVEAETSGAHHGQVKRNEKHNANDVPLIMWSNGGPGASSLFGLFTELGPFNVNDNSLKTADYNATGVPTLWYNDFAWNKLGSILVFDWPPPTGFSFCDGDAAGDGTSCGTWSDTRQAEVSYAALKGFFAKFPELAGAQPLYLTGESYAGVYVPKLGQQIFAHGKAEEWRLTGVAIGDACMGSEVTLTLTLTLRTRITLHP
jgi:carboxypeptidase C (cathepsin A)